MPQSNREIVMQFVEIINGHDFSRLAEVVVPDYIQHAPHAQQGLAGLIAFFESLLSAMPDLKGEIEMLVSEGPLIAAKTTVTGTKDGKLDSTSIADFWRVEDSKLVEHW